MRAPLLTTLGLLALGATPAQASRIDTRIVPQPKITYYVSLPDWKAPMKRVVKALNAQHVGVRLVLAQIPEQASIQVGRLDRRCGLPGVGATTQTLVGGYAALYLPRRCGATQASIIAAHELGHALGLKHEDRRCALMNSSGTGALSIPTHCLGGGYDWRKRPFRKDDIAGLKKLYRNTAPTVTLKLKSAPTLPVGTPAEFAITATDRQRNLSVVRIAYGDGRTEERDPGGSLSGAHAYTQPGSYTITVTALDYYLKRDTAKVVVTVVGA